MGRVANRIANASFNLDGHTYNLGANDRCCCRYDPQCESIDTPSKLGLLACDSAPTH